jgi:tRNA dimethylallyltransferase
MQRVIALIGPTAVGKSAVALEVAQALGAEIVSCDAMQVYRHLRVLTQAPTHAQRVLIQHHLVECVEPTHAFSVGEYRRIAVPIINQILERGKRVLVVGGSGLYLKSLTDGLCDAPPADVRLREQLWSECRGVGAPMLYDRLRGVDSAAAERIHPNDARRIIRALEVYTLTGRPISSWWRQASAELLRGQVTLIGLTRDRDALYRRINDRVLRQVYEEGVINEARQVLGWQLSRSARQIHGLSDIEQYLGGECSLRDMLTTWQQRVRNYARRQLVWFRQTPDLHWLDIPEDERPWETAARVLDALHRARHEAVPVAG